MFYYYRRQIRLVVGLLLLVGAVYGVIKGWMYHNVRQVIEELSVQAAGRAEIAYEGIDTGLQGVVSVRGITVTPRGADQALRIERVRLSGPPLSYFLWGRGSDKQAPPDHLNLNLDGISINLDPKLFAALRQDLPTPVEQAEAANGCGPGESLDPELLHELGFRQLLMDMSFRYGYDRRQQRLDADMDMSIHHLERIQASLALADVSLEDMQKGNMASIPSLAGLQLVTNVEPDFGRRYMAACAKRQGLEPDAYREQLVNRTLANLQQAGLHLGIGLTQALRDYHQQWGELSISAEPAKPVGLMALMFSPPQNWQRLLGIRVSLNQRKITDLSFTMHPPDPAEMAVLLGKEPPPQAPRKPRIRYRYVYKPAPVARLNELLGAEVRLHLRDQPLRSGILVAVEGGEARVEQRLHGGKMTAHVPLDEIVRVEVQAVEKIAPARP